MFKSELTKYHEQLLRAGTVKFIAVEILADLQNHKSETKKLLDQTGDVNYSFESCIKAALLIYRANKS